MKTLVVSEHIHYALAKNPTNILDMKINAKNVQTILKVRKNVVNQNSIN